MVHFRDAKMVKKIRKKLDRIAANRSQFNFISGAWVEGETVNRKTALIVPTDEIYGRDEKKTTLAQLVYNHQQVKAHFEIQSWAYVSSDFQVKKLTRKISQSINKASCGTLELEEMHATLQNMLEAKRFLIVLDDVWTEEMTNKALIGGAKGSIVIVTPKNHTSCKTLARVPMFQYQLLIRLKLAFSLERGSEDENITKIESSGKKITKKCNGNSLAVNKSSVWKSVKEFLLLPIIYKSACPLCGIKLFVVHICIKKKSFPIS
ncbi:hypothetical protein OSB04_026539 [Centaurea solstitialis]|uniref:NB-ARC domain-containing protein n=1 Tax=Centaurea solstitialis TaxID=347529 RepID=A0AA38SJJ5_9ASTR|nr:hypothetical protein OSB04_026539 [Centaurea solstitialis]